MEAKSHVHVITSYETYAGTSEVCILRECVRTVSVLAYFKDGPWTGVSQAAAATHSTAQRSLICSQDS